MQVVRQLPNGCCDILKDFNHYKEKHPAGYVFTRASKYIVRFLLAFIALDEKLEGTREGKNDFGRDRAERAKNIIESTLLQCRKNGNDKVDEGILVDHMRQALEVSTIPEAQERFKEIFLAANCRVANQTAQGTPVKGLRSMK